MSWFAAVGQILFLVVASAALGSLYGYPLQAIILVLLAIFAFWFYQMRRVQQWLREPTQTPPDTYGIWGELLSRIYAHQRKNLEAQKRLQFTVKYLQDSFAAMRDGVVMVDDMNAIKWFNHAVEPLLGLRYPEDTGQTLTNLVRTPVFTRYLLGGDYTTPLQYVASVGNTRFHLRVEITHFGEGERLLFIRDVSDAVRMEKIRSDFVANVSHELRTPLTVISGYLDNFLGDTEAFPAHYVNALNQMSQQAKRMETLLKDLLWLSRIEDAQRKELHESVDVKAMLLELRDEVAESSPGSNLILDIDTDQNIHGDYRQLYSAASNLVMNAIKYSPLGSPVTIKWRREGGSCLMQVLDKGIGIDSAHIHRLTERFYRVDDSRNSSTGGTGLGLAIVKHVAAAHSAQLSIESRLGKGSTFTLIFPVRG
jgi:two-component system phosphate regulon sensor histidine kinase PhoR